MAWNVFISFRFADGIQYKEYFSKLLLRNYSTVDFSEDEDRSQMSDETIRQYLYGKLRHSSITIVLLTPQAVNHRKNWYGMYDDWIYDEIRYSLEDREQNRTNGMIAVYTPEAAHMLVYPRPGTGTETIIDVDNLFRKNMMNVKPLYKVDPRPDIFDPDYDSYCSLIPWNLFINNIDNYVDIAVAKRNIIERYNIVKRL